MGIFSWIVFGFIAGLISKAIMPGRNPQGCMVTTVLGIVGAMVGGYIGTRMGWGTVHDFSLRSFGVAIVGALIVLLIYHALRGR